MATRKTRTKVKFSDPPPASRNHDYDWEQVAQQLRARPGEWAVIFEQDRLSLVTAIRVDGITALKKSKGFFVRTANNTPRSLVKAGQTAVCDLWMMYDPEFDREGSN